MIKVTELTDKVLLDELLTYRLITAGECGVRDDDRFFALLQEVRDRMASFTQIAIATQQLNSILRRAKAELEHLQEIWV